MTNDLILVTYPFVIFTAVITAIVVGYAIVRTSKDNLVLWWLMVGILVVAIALAFENALFLYGRSGGAGIYEYVSNSAMLYCLKLLYGIGMWIHFVAAFSAIYGTNKAMTMIFKGLIAWLISYSLSVLIYLTFIK